LAKNLLIVESPGKIKTLSKFLGKDFIIEASKGHIVDLPESRLGVDSENGFVPAFRVVEEREDVIRKLMELAKDAKLVYLAPDPDREGEAISWHLANVLNIDPTALCRVTFNSITKEEVLQALDNPRPINLNLVNAQQSRRILDRLVGYRLSPLLWKKVSLGLSAGRVQSVAVLFICEREKEILSFQPLEYWTIDALVEFTAKKCFPVKLVKTDGKKPVISDEKTAMETLNEIKNSELIVSSVNKRIKKQTPSPPFITSTLQQEASQRFSFTSKRTMSIAQKLYEGIELGSEGPVGLITYMRTDSVRVSSEGLNESRAFILKEFGEKYSLPTPRLYKSRKEAQDAHEAIRPTSVWRTPDSLSRNLSNEALKLYTLIWRRFVASQMAEAQFEVLTIDISSGRHLLQTSGTTLTFDGFTTLYTETQSEETNSDNGHTDESNDKTRLPNLKKDQKLELDSITPKQNFTSPPPRFTESMLIKTLEKEGIGRPSTYAAIIETIQQRGYVKKVDGKFHPSDAAFLTTQILTSGFTDIINPRFTAVMETYLDEIEEGNKDWVKILKDFYEPFMKDLKKAETEMQKARVESDCICSKCGRPMIVKLGRTGKFLACSGYPECKSTENIPEEILLFANGVKETPVKLREILDKIKAETPPDPDTTEYVCETCGAPMVIKKGRFGKFIACSKYPECKTTKKILQDIGIKCPIDGCSGVIVQKKSKKHRLFYGCSKYPECKMTTWEKPTGELCPQCRTPLVWHSTKKLGTYKKCSAKECGFKLLSDDSQKEEGNNSAQET